LFFVENHENKYVYKLSFLVSFSFCNLKIASFWPKKDARY